MGQHCEETNELYNLMARHIKKRGEERINLFTVEQVQEPDASGKNKKASKMVKQATRSPNRKSTSRGNTPPREQEMESPGDAEEKTKMQTMLSQR